MPDDDPLPAPSDEVLDVNLPKHIAKILSDPSLVRDELDVRVLCAWNNIEPGKQPKNDVYWTHYANPAMRAAWHRVIEAVRAFDKKE